GVPSVSFNALIGHRSCAPEDYRKDLRTLRQGPVPVSYVFPAGSDSRLLETRLQAIRLSPYRADLPARRPAHLGNGRRFPNMLLSPVTFQITGQPSDPKTPPPVHARYAGYIAVRLVAHAEHPFARGGGKIDQPSATLESKPTDISACRMHPRHAWCTTMAAVP